MANLTITATDVLAGSGAIKTEGTAGVAITAGQVVYVDTADGNTIKLADKGAAASSQARGIALNNAGVGQPVDYHSSGPIDLGVALTVGEVYVLTTSGQIAPIADLAQGDYVTILGHAAAADDLRVAINATGVQKA